MDDDQYECAGAGIEEPFKYLVIVLVLILAVIVAIGVYESHTRLADATDKAVRTQPGTPLDAVRVNAPSFADGDVCCKVMNRGSNN